VVHVPYIESYLNTKIYYEVYGSKRAPPLLILTGIASNILQWQPTLVEELARNFRVILMDNRGSGRSGSSRRFYTMKTYTKDIKNLLQNLQIKKTHILAHSLGASMAQRFTITHPTMVNKLVLICPDIGGFQRKLPSLKIIRMLIRGMKTDTHALLKHAFCIQEKHSIDKKYSRKAVDCIDRIFRYYPISSGDYRKQLIAGIIFNTQRKITKIFQKTLIYSGEFDKVLLPENGVKLARVLPNSTLSIVHNCGHLFLYDDLKPIFTELYEFLE
jgi:pimeloyl-ACP methyl ester carboxylesterase